MMRDEDADDEDDEQEAVEDDGAEEGIGAEEDLDLVHTPLALPTAKHKFDSPGIASQDIDAELITGIKNLAIEK